MKRAIVFGGAGFIGTHLVDRLRSEGYWVRAVDRFNPGSRADEFLLGDLRKPEFVKHALFLNWRGDSIEGADELYQLAAEMGGAGYIFTGDNDARIVHDSALINLHTARAAVEAKVQKLFFASSACVYPWRNQTDPAAPLCAESSVYPAEPDSEYGWEKLFAERTYLAHARNYGLEVKIARLHNVFGPGNPIDRVRAKAPGALCRKVAEARDGGEVEIWGDGEQTRSFLYIDDAVDGIRALMGSSCPGPVNIGSERMIAIVDLARQLVAFSGKRLKLKPVPGPVGVRGRVSDNTLMHAATGWQPRVELERGLLETYRWVAHCIAAAQE